MSVPAEQPAMDYNARFGKPRVERYRIDAKLRLSVEYRIDGRIAAIEIAPADYRGFHSSTLPEMPSETADNILESLLRGSTVTGSVVETTVESVHPGFSRQIRTLPEVSLIRDYPLGTDRSKMIAAGLEVGSTDLSNAADQVISRLGEPEYREFAAGSGLALGVYGSAVRQITIFAAESLLAHNPYATPIAPDAAETLLIELLPASARTDQTWKSLFQSGAYKSHRVHFPRFLVCRNYVNDDMIGISIGWPIP